MKLQSLLLALFISIAIGAWLVFFPTPQTAAEKPALALPVTTADASRAAPNPASQNALPQTRERASTQRQDGLPLPLEAGQSPRPALPPGYKPPGAAFPMPTPEPGYVPVMVLDCAAMFADDQPSQRNCEAGEKKRLAADCTSAKTREAEAATNAARKTQEILVRSVCREAERVAGRG